jgi:MFS family permease
MSTPEHAPMRRGDWLGLLTLALGVALVVVDISIVDLILPPIAQDLDLGFAELQWVVAIFPLVVAALVIPAGRTGNRRGARGLYLVGFSVFIVASLLAALAPGFGVLAAARALQGVGAAATLTCSLAVINAANVSRARETAFIVYGTAFAFAGALGPLVGGLIADASN